MRRRLRAAALLVGSAAAVVALAGCQVSTRVAVDERSAGQGDVLIAVTFDRAAVSALGGLRALSSDLDLAGLASAGWHVAGPSGAADGGAVVSASHPFHTDGEAASLVADLAGTGSAAGRPFRLQLTQRTTFWHVYSGMAGTVDLTCGLDCFGDPALKAATGHILGVDPAPLLGAQDPARSFSFALQAHLPGRVSATNASYRSVAGGSQVLGWTPELGRALTLTAQTESWNRGSVTLVAAGLGAVVLALLLVTVRWMWRRHFRRGVGAHSARPGHSRWGRRRGGGASEVGAPEAGSPLGDAAPEAGSPLGGAAPEAGSGPAGPGSAAGSGPAGPGSAAGSGGAGSSVDSSVEETVTPPP